MRSSRLLLGLVPAFPVLVLVASCNSQGASRIGLVLRAPQGVLQTAKAVDLSVFDAASVSCKSTGYVDILKEQEGTQVFALESTGCQPGIAWCKTIALDRDDSVKTFAVVARDATGDIAQGCTTQKISQDPLDVTIKVQLANSEQCCSDNILQPGEQCEGPEVSARCGGIAETDLCDAQCVAKEFQLADVREADPALPEGGKAKSELAMAFCPGVDPYAGGLRALYTSDSTDKWEGSDINVRMLTKDLTPITDPLAYEHQLRLPLLCKLTEGIGGIKAQRSPAIAPVSSSKIAAVFLSNEDSAAQFEVFLSAQTQHGCADESPVKISTTAPVGGENAEKPDVAGGPDGLALAVWVRGGKARGRIWQTPLDGIGIGTFIPSDPTIELDLAPNALAASVKSVRVAATSSGWVIAYQAEGAGDNDGGIFMSTVDKMGVPGKEQLVNVATAGVQDQPDIAVLKGGTRVVVWRNAGDIFFQRFDDTGMAIGDQFNKDENPLNSTVAGEQANPVVAAPSEGGEFFVVAWEEVDTSDISARLVQPAQGFLPNSVTGQNDAFVASYPGVASMRKLPAVAVGPSVVIGWQDESPEHEGVFIRRFPLPK